MRVDQAGQQQPPGQVPHPVGRGPGGREVRAGADRGDPGAVNQHRPGRMTVLAASMVTTKSAE
jgi:hypothetical protein